MILKMDNPNLYGVLYNSESVGFSFSQEGCKILEEFSNRLAMPNHQLRSDQELLRFMVEKGLENIVNLPSNLYLFTKI